MKITIVTPSYNQGRFLPATADSILGQRGDFTLEWLVVDGGSTDDTLDVLRSLDDPRLQWTSEPDRGQSHAINKGLARATGDVVAWLNSDDLYADGALDCVARTFATEPETPWLVGRCDMIDEQGQPVRPRITAYKNRSLARYTYRRLLRENFVSQPAVFWRRAAGEQVGPLDESLHYTMDYDLWLRLGKLADPALPDAVLAHFRVHRESKSGQINREQFDEQYRVACRYFDNDRASRFVHRCNVEKIVLAYRTMRRLGLG
ncbi:MAG: glycosyltransferase family 2 protein [Phycisphaeraceae bacterium]